MSKQRRVSLSDAVNKQMWESALQACVNNKRFLSEAEEKFVNDMESAYQMAGDMMSPTVKQFNWLRQIAWDL